MQLPSAHTVQQYTNLHVYLLPKQPIPWYNTAGWDIIFQEEIRMVRFECDYNNGCVPEILSTLAQTNAMQLPGYGEDSLCSVAAERIRTACQAPNAAVHFLVGGTQTNLITIAAALRPHQGVISAGTGHINVHETGAIEATGHKVLVVESPDSKVNAAVAEAYCKAYTEDESREHIVQPGMIYISFPTENGLLYTKGELQALRKVCDAYGLMLYADGARLGYGLAAPENDVSFSDLYQLTDAFYIGGTKVGALFGEALVIRNTALNRDFRAILKQKGGMLAKGRLLGLQFNTLFTDDLYMRISRHAMEEAARIRRALLDKGIPMFIDSPTNQLFPIFENSMLKKLTENFVFSTWSKADAHHTVVRICTSWATLSSDTDALIEAIQVL